MTRNAKLRLSLIAAASAAGFALFSQGASASTDLTVKCRGDSYNSVLACCRNETFSQRPLWMLEAHATCSTAGVVQCKSGRGKPQLAAVGAGRMTRCYVKRVIKVNDSHDTSVTHETRGSRDGKQGDSRPSTHG
jgi:hypothetical protein